MEEKEEEKEEEEGEEEGEGVMEKEGAMTNCPQKGNDQYAVFVK